MAYIHLSCIYCCCCRSFAKAVQQELIRGPGDHSDLAAINIQRGRERGLPGYNTFRSLCGLQKATSFDQFKTEIASAVVDKMADVYKHPDDVDLFVGGLLESHVGEGALGPTFSCLIAEQFKRLRSGDRFWYENKSEVGFTEDQLQELRKVSLARMLCDTSDDIKDIPKKVLSVKSVQVACESLPSMDLTKWKVDNDK